MSKIKSEQKKWYVYRFKDLKGDILYVGRTENIYKRFSNHEHLSDKVKTIEYIECQHPAEMAWKEIYYINLYYNEKSENVSDVYSAENYEEAKFITYELNDKWIKFDKKKLNPIITDVDKLNQEYEEYVLNAPKLNYKKLIHLCEDERLYRYDDKSKAYTRNWFFGNKDPYVIKQVKNDLIYWIRRINIAKSGECLWSTFDECYNILKSGGFTKSFISIDAPMTKKYRNRKILAYLANNFSPIRYLSVEENNQYALAKLLKFLFRSALSKGQEIQLYLPSSRMRELLISWIEENSIES